MADLGRIPANRAAYMVKGTHPWLKPPMVRESCSTAAAADARANQLFAAGYNVTVIYSGTGDHADSAQPM
jgi:hypothetical protein